MLSFNNFKCPCHERLVLILANSQMTNTSSFSLRHCQMISKKTNALYIGIALTNELGQFFWYQKKLI